MEIFCQIIHMIDKVKLTAIPVTVESDLYGDIGLDSITFIALLMDIEERYSITFQLSEMEECLRVSRLMELVKKKIEEVHRL